MNIITSIKIIKEMQKWRRSEGKYGKDEPMEMPFSPSVYGRALDSLINFAEQTISKDLLLEKLEECATIKTEEE